MMFNPRQTILVTCRGTIKHLGKQEEIEDIFPLHWHSPCSVKPPRYSIFVSKKMPACDLIRTSQSFVVNFMSYDNVKEITASGMFHSQYHDKFSKVSLTRAECEKLVDNVRIKEAIAWLECKVSQEIDAGDHLLFIGDILYSEEVKDEKKPFHVDGKSFTTTR